MGNRNRHLETEAIKYRLIVERKTIYVAGLNNRKSERQRFSSLEEAVQFIVIDSWQTQRRGFQIWTKGLPVYETPRETLMFYEKKKYDLPAKVLEDYQIHLVVPFHLASLIKKQITP